MEYVDCVVLGNKGIGKHSLIGGFQNKDGNLDDEVSLSLTIDKKKVDFVVKIIDETVDNKLRRLMYLKADVVILGYSAIDLTSYHAVREKWITELHFQAPHVPVLLMGTKLDRVPDDLLDKVKAKGEKTAKELGCVGFQDTSSVSSVNTQLFERAVQAGLVKKRVQRTINETDPKKKKHPFYGFTTAKAVSNNDLMDATEEANIERAAKISANTTDYAYKWRGELVTLLMEDLLDGRVDYTYSDAERDMTENFSLDFAVESAGQISKKLLIFFHFLPIVNTCMEQHNLQFWFDVEDYKYNKETRNMKKAPKAKKLKKDALRIFQDYITPSAPREINVDSEVRSDITIRINNATNNRLFDLAQLHILTQLATLFKDQYVLSHTVKALLHTLKSLRNILPTIVVDGEAETVPLPTGDTLSRMMSSAVHIMTLMEFLHSSNAPEKRPAKPQFLKFEDEDRIVKMGVKYLLFFAALKTHMDKEKSQENLMFWLDAEDFRSLDFGAPREDDPEHERMIKRLLAVRATHIVRRYVDDDAEMLVNLPGHITKQIKISLAELQEAAKAPASKRMDEIVLKSQNMFDAAQREILVLMKRDSWRRFHASSEAMNIRKLLDKLCVHEEYEDPERLRNETRLHNRFDLMSDERLVRSFTCALERKVLLHGQLFITKRHVCFFSNVFGFKSKLCYNFSEIWEISNIDAGTSAKKRGVTPSDGSIIMKTTDRQVHVFSHVVPSHQQLLYVFRKARQRLEKGHDEPPNSTITVLNDTDDREDEDNTRGLNEKDWELFKEGAEIMEFKNGAVILTQGHAASSIFQIARGTVAINKSTTQGNTVTLRTCTQGEIIGEISFVEGGTASASVVASSDDVVIYAMSREFIESALVNNPGLPGRFYRFLATLLAERLRTKKNVSESNKPESITALTDDQFYSVFGFKSDTPIMNRWECAIKAKSLIMYGTLYLVPSALCFYSKVLGSVKKRIIPLSDITHVTTNKNMLGLTHRTVDAKTEFVHMEECNAARDIIQTQITECRKSTSEIRDVLPPEDDIDWTMFLSGAELKRYDKDEPILEENSPSRYVYQLASGSATAQKISEDTNKPEVFRKLFPGEMFGEMSFLQEHAPSASIVAAEDNTMVYNIDKKFVDSLLELNPELPGRFYKFLASSLAARLRN